VRRLNFDIDAVHRPRRAAHALGRRLGLCRWWLIRYVEHPRTLKAADVVARVEQLLDPERPRLVRLASLYDQRQPFQQALFDPVSVLPEMRPRVRKRDFSAWLRERGQIAAQVSEVISHRAAARWRANRDGDALVGMIASGQLDTAWVQQALVEVQGEELSAPDTQQGTQAARLLERIGHALLAGGRGRRRRGGPRQTRAHNALTQARSRRKTKLMKEITRRARQGEDRTTVANEVLYDFVNADDPILDREQRTSVERAVRDAL